MGRYGHGMGLGAERGKKSDTLVERYEGIGSCNRSRDGQGMGYRDEQARNQIPLGRDGREWEAATRVEMGRKWVKGRSEQGNELWTEMEWRAARCNWDGDGRSLAVRGQGMAERGIG